MMPSPSTVPFEQLQRDSREVGAVYRSGDAGNVSDDPIARLVGGDNNKPWRDLHDTPRHGNELVPEIFHVVQFGRRNRVPPIFVFSPR